MNNGYGDVDDDDGLVKLQIQLENEWLRKWVEEYLIMHN